MSEEQLSPGLRRSLECLERSAWTYLEDDGIVARRPCRLEGLCVNVGTGGDGVTLYSGQDAGAGRIIGTFKASSSFSTLQNLLPPLPCPNGIYAVFNGNCDNVTVFWSVI